MKLHHWSPPQRDGSPVTNFGDELNTDLWPRLLGRTFFDDDDSVAFLGIGSLLGWPKDGDATRRHRVVFGTGAAFPDAAAREPAEANWRVYCVRGPLTARAYELDESLAVADPAILLAKFHGRTKPVARFGYMPHIDEARRWAHILTRVCEEMGVRYIDPRRPVDEVIQAVGSVSVMFAEAMHGAITADALRVPWVAVYGTARPHRFKWTDWCASMRLEYQPRRLANVASWGDTLGLRGSSVDDVAGRLFEARFRRLATRCRPMLSDGAVHAEKMERLDGALAELAADVTAGRYAMDHEPTPGRARPPQ